MTIHPKPQLAADYAAFIASNPLAETLDGLEYVAALRHCSVEDVAAAVEEGETV